MYYDEQFLADMRSELEDRLTAIDKDIEAGHTH